VSEAAKLALDADNTPIFEAIQALSNTDEIFGRDTVREN
jgi:hypothetical protein